MPRRHYDLEEVLAFAESGKSAPEIVEILDLSVSAAAISKQVRKYLGPRPRRPVAREDGLRRRVIAAMETNGLDRRYCFLCGRLSLKPTYIRELKYDDDLGTLAFVCLDCKRAGDH